MEYCSPSGAPIAPALGVPSIFGAVRVGLALGGGSVRGFAHLGFLKVLIAEGIEVHCVAGTSSGAIVGAVFAAGRDLNEVERITLRTNWRRLADFTLGGGGFVRGERLMAFLREIVEDRNLEEFRPALAITAVDLAVGELVVFQSGSVLRALRASISLPGIFVPVREENRLLVDGGILNNVPADIARRMGAEVVVAVDVACPQGRPAVEPIQRRRLGRDWNASTEELATMEDLPELVGLGQYGPKEIPNRMSRADLLRRSYEVMKNSLTRAHMQEADLIVRPNVHGVASFDFRQAERCIRAGEAAARAALPAIRRLVAEGAPVAGVPHP